MMVAKYPIAFSLSLLLMLAFNLYRDGIGFLKLTTKLVNLLMVVSYGF